MNSQVLKTDIEEHGARAVEPLLRMARAGTITPAIMAQYLASVHFLVAYTPTALTLAQRAAERSGDAALAAYFEKKIAEEQGHARWAADDLKRLCEKFNVCAPDGPVESMKGLVNFQRQTIETSPREYLAYILVAEYLIVLLGPTWVESLEKHCGIPSSVVSVITRHAELDKHHVNEGLKDIDALVNEPGQVESLRHTLRRTLDLLAMFARELNGLVACSEP